MIITDPDNNLKHHQDHLLDVTESFAAISAAAAAGPSRPIEPPPPFAENTSAADKALNAELASSDVFVPLGGEEPPPEFTPYEAEYFYTGNQDVVSHDKHLNDDGEALYRFLLSEARSPPKLLVSLHGSHKEHRYRTVTHKDAKGHTKTRTESYEETIVDFSFSIDLSQHIIPNSVVHWSVPDEEPAYRGKMYKEVDDVAAAFIQGGTLSSTSSSNGGGAIRLPDDVDELLESAEVGGAGQRKNVRRKAVKQEIKSAKQWKTSRWERGLPPWIGPGSVAMTASGVTGAASAIGTTAEANVLKSSKTLREWADEYCASDKWLKEFTYEKVIYGWNIGALQAAITAAVKSTYYDGDFEVNFNISHSKIHIRTDSPFARLLSKTWFKVLLWVFLIYPFIWLYKRFHHRGGGRWEVCGGAYALKRWQPLDEEDPSAPPPPFSETDERVAHGAVSGHAKLVGMKEGEWFQRWEATIKRGVTGRTRLRDPMISPDRSTPEATMLDGYRVSY
ncbi:hypothetical protein BXZ70DRAFT_1008159 [Cristinia sonorae]|uniref:Uncharacterized protein n=1 Tax=Cristinia sonorae TaxID=1940300 RepID=A0A8K0UPM7_9AGAR|nr:hypothetical protein BXZ70DRAFT_1008159 [Cristinia sonorae]